MLLVDLWFKVSPTAKVIWRSQKPGIEPVTPGLQGK